jgi:isoquinoline 1-oxidoreductase alpha subunit
MQLTVNSVQYEFDIEPDTPLLWVIRDEVGLTGTKFGCGLAQCGACTVLINGQPARSCVTPVQTVAGKDITTIEAVQENVVGRKVVETWVARQVPQCGYCQSGQVITATALLSSNPTPSDKEIADAMVNLCRCGTYNAIRAALLDASGRKEDAS